MTFNHDPHNFIVQPEKLVELNQEIGAEVPGNLRGHWRIEFVLISSYFIKVFHNFLNLLVVYSGSSHQKG